MNSSKKNTQLIYGRNPVIEAIKGGKEFERVYLKDQISGEMEIEVRTLCREKAIPLKKVPLIKLDRLVNARNHQGIIGVMSMIQYQKLNNVIPFLFEQGKNPIIMIVDNVKDIRNIGAIARSCEVLGAHALVLSGKNSGIINEDAMKTSAGALSRLIVCREKTTLDVIEILKAYGVKSVGTSLNAKNDLVGNLEGPLGIILGSEFDGLHITIENKCNHLVKIPQIGETDSLNVSVAAGIILYEAMKQNKT